MYNGSLALIRDNCPIGLTLKKIGDSCRIPVYALDPSGLRDGERERELIQILEKRSQNVWIILEGSENILE